MKQNFDPWIIGGSVSVGVAVLALVIAHLTKGKKKSQQSKNGRRSRTMSFNSSVMVSGGFPKEAKVWSPIINCLFLVKECPNNVALMGACKKLLFFDRFRSKVVFDGEDWRYEECDLNFADYIKTHNVMSEAEVMKEADRIATDDLEQDRPLWCFHRIVNKGTGVSAVLIRVHHVIGDGIALVNAMQKILDDEKGNPVTIELPGSKIKAVGGDKPVAPSMFQILKSFFGIVSLPASPYDTKTSFVSANQKQMVMNKRRKTLIFPTLKLSFVKELKNKAGVTINDILLTAVTGAVRRYCEKRGDTAFQNTKNIASLVSRCLMPIALPRSQKVLDDPVSALINRWVFLSVQLPMAPATAKERLAECTAITTQLKTAPTAGVQLWLQRVMPLILPQFLQQKTAFDIFTRHSMVFSNVPGPGQDIYLCGEKVVGMQILFPNLVPQCLLISYADSIFFNMSLDDENLPAAAFTELPGHYLAELRELAIAYGVDASDATVLSALSPEGVFGVVGSGR